MMGVYWLLIILLSCTTSGRCNEQQWDVQCTTAKSPEYVFVPCPNMFVGHTTDKDTVVTHKLYKNQQVVQVCRNTQKLCNQTDPDIHPEKDENGTLTGFKLTRNANPKQAIYMCEGKVTYPPPVISNNSTVIFLEEGQGCLRKTEECKTEEPEPEEQKTGIPVWIWIVVVALLSTYSLAATITALIIWYKMKDADSQSDYMNTKPRPPAKRRKKREVQHPIPKHF